MLTFLSIVFVVVCLLLVFMVVITPSQSEGLAGAFGGMGSDTFFGTKAGQHINRFTILLAVAFIALAVLINRVGGARTQAQPDMFEGRPAPTVPAAPDRP